MATVTPALSHFWMSRRTLRPPTRCSTNFASHSWSRVSPTRANRVLKLGKRAATVTTMLSELRGKRSDRAFFEPARHLRFHGAFYLLGLVGIVGCSNSVAIRHSQSGGKISTDGAGDGGGIIGSGGSGGTFATGGIPAADAALLSPDMGMGIPGTGGMAGGGVVSAGGIGSLGGGTGGDGVPAMGGMAGGGGSVPGGASGIAGATGNGPVFGMSCTTNGDCPSGSTCCDGSSESCDGTRLPSGDGTNSGEFVVSVDGSTVTDTITGLVWQSDGSGARSGCNGGVNGAGSGNLTCTWSEAQAYCAGLSLGGLSGWRLPAVKELSTIVDLTRDTPSIDQFAFPNTPSYWFWTSSPHASPRGSAASWVDFGGGACQYTSWVELSFWTRCVRGSRCYPTSRFLLLPSGLVQDMLTGLVWQQDGSGTRAGCSGSSNLTCTWAEAQAYCTEPESGLRLPTVKELLSIVDDTVASGPTINQTAFPNTPTDFFWTSSPCDIPSGDSWIVDFGSGSSNNSDVGASNRVRCVR